MRRGQAACTGRGTGCGGVGVWTGELASGHLESKDHKTTKSEVRLASARHGYIELKRERTVGLEQVITLKTHEFHAASSTETQAASRAVTTVPPYSRAEGMHKDGIRPKGCSWSP